MPLPCSHILPPLGIDIQRSRRGSCGLQHVLEMREIRVLSQRRVGARYGRQCLTEEIAMGRSGVAHELSGQDQGVLGKPRNQSGLLFSSDQRSEEHTSELQSLMRISYAVFCLKKKNKIKIESY